MKIETEFRTPGGSAGTELKISEAGPEGSEELRVFLSKRSDLLRAGFQDSATIWNPRNHLKSQDCCSPKGVSWVIH